MIFNISPQASTSLAIDYRLHDAVNLQVAVYDAAGKLLRILLEGFKDSGAHSLVWENSTLQKGSYFIHFRQPHRQWVKKVSVC